MADTSDLAAVLRRLDAGEDVDDVEGRHVEVKADASLAYQRGVPTARGVARHEPTARKVADAAACLANSGGGLVVLGIHDPTGRPDGTPADLDWLADRLVALTRPPVAASLEEVMHRSRRLVAITVAGAGDEPHRGPDSRHGHGTRYTIRVGRQCVELEFGTWARRLEVRHREQADWSAAVTSTTVEAADDGAVARLRALVAGSRDETVRAASDADVPTLLRTVGLGEADGRLNRAGHLLLVDATPAGLDYHFTDRPDGLPQDRRRGDGRPLLLVLADLDVQMAAHNPDHPEVEGFVVTDRRAIAPESLREAVVNAVAHRDYSRPGVGIQVRHTADRLEVESTGPLLHDVEGRVLSASQPRNHRLADALRRLGLADRVGRGVDAMYRQALLRGHPRPIVASVGASTRCVLVGGPPDPAVAGPLARITPTEALTAEVLVAIDELRRRPWIDVDALGGLLGLPAAEVAIRASGWVRRLRLGDASVLAWLDAGATVLTLADGLRHAMADGIDWFPARREVVAEHVVAFAERTGRISRADVLAMTGASAPSASNWLSDLAAEGHLRVGAPRGRDAHYLPAEPPA